MTLTADAPAAPTAAAPHASAAAAVDAAEEAAASLWWSFLPSLSTVLIGLAVTGGLTIATGLFSLYWYQRSLIYPRHVPPVRVLCTSSRRTAGGSCGSHRCNVLC